MARPVCLSDRLRREAGSSLSTIDARSVEPRRTIDRPPFPTGGALSSLDIEDVALRLPFTGVASLGRLIGARSSIELRSSDATLTKPTRPLDFFFGSAAPSAPSSLLNTSAASGIESIRLLPPPKATRRFTDGLPTLTSSPMISSTGPSVSCSDAASRSISEPQYCCGVLNITGCGL